MTQVETRKILAIVCEAYPAFIKDRSIESTVTIWQKVFADDPYENVENGLMAFIATDTKGFAPMPGAIKEQMANLMEQGTESLSEIEAWNLVAKAASRSAYNAKEEFAKLPRDIQRLVGNPETLKEWSQMEPEEFFTVHASNFQRSYKARKQIDREFIKIPSGMRIAAPAEEPERLIAPAAEPDERISATPMPESVRELMTKLFGVQDAV